MKARLLILGALHRGDLHPYEIKRRFEAAMVDCYLDIDVGTLYYAVRQLEKDSFIAPVAEERVIRGGVRTIYRLTLEGRAEFQKGFFGQFDLDGPVSQTLYGAMLFLHCVERTRLIDAIKKKISRLDELIVKLAPLEKQLAPKLSTGGKHLFGHIQQQRELDRSWLQSLLTDVDSGHNLDGTVLVNVRRKP